MGSGYETQRTGMASVLYRLERIEAAQRALAAAAPIRNAGISGGDGLTIGDADVAPTVRLFANADDEQGRILFSPSTPDQQEDWGASILFQEAFGTGGGSLSMNSPAAPESRVDDQPAQVASVTLGSGDGVADQAAIYLSVGDQRSQVSVVGALTGVIPTRINLGNGFIEDDGFSGTSYRYFMGLGSLVWPYTVAEVRVRDQSDSAYIPIRASAFTVTSTAAAKQNVGDLGWSPLEAVKAAKARRWHYLPEQGDPTRVHVGPMAEDLPPEIVDNTSETPALDLAVLVGVLWGAVQELAAQVEALTTQRDQASTDTEGSH